MSKPQLKLFNPEIKTYNHAFDLAFQVEGSEYEHGDDCLKHEIGKVIDSLNARINHIFSSDEYVEAIGCFDTFNEEQ
mgnify:CR=1 FL=1